MKWIGQHIYDLASRFRNDVFLEDISTGTIASGAHLGLDSNNKIVKAVDGGGDLTSIVAGTGLSGTSLTGPIPTINIDAAQPTITSLGTLTALDVDNININDKAIIITGDTDDTFSITTGAAGATTLTTIDDNAAAGHFEIAADGNITLDAAGNIALEGGDMTIGLRGITHTNTVTSQGTSHTLKSTDNSAGNKCYLGFLKDKGAAGADDDIIGEIGFNSDNSAQQNTGFAKIQAEVETAADTDEAGRLNLQVATSDGTTSALQDGIVLRGHGTTNDIDVTIANGSASTTTIAGTLTMGSTATLTNAGLLAVANQSNITGLGTIGTGVWQGTAVASAYLDADTAHLTTAQTFTGSKTMGTDTKLNFRDANAYIYSPTANDLEIVATDIVLDAATSITLEQDTNVSGTLTVGVDDAGHDVIFYGNAANKRVAWDTSVDHLKLYDDTKIVFGTGSAEADYDGSIYWDQTDLVIDSESDLQILSNAIVTGDLTVNGDTVTFQSANADDPHVVIKNTHDSTDNGARLDFNKLRADDGVEQGMNLGEIWFTGQDNAQNAQDYAYIVGEIDVGTHGQESGQIVMGVANHDGGAGHGFTMTGGSVNDEIDITLGKGTASTTTVAGDLTVTSKLTCASRTLAVSSSTDGDHDGDVVYFGGTTSMTIGKIYHYKSDGTWEIVNADAVATSDGLLAVALGAASDTNGMLLRGMVTLDHDPGAIGDVLYVQSDNAGVPGNATATPPAVSGDCVRIIGYQVSHASNGNIWFNPDNTFVEVA